MHFAFTGVRSLTDADNESQSIWLLNIKLNYIDVDQIRRQSDRLDWGSQLYYKFGMGEIFKSLNERRALNSNRMSKSIFYFYGHYLSHFLMCLPSWLTRFFKLTIEIRFAPANTHHVKALCLEKECINFLWR